MARKYEIGDVHAPVEDVDVSWNLKLLVLFMIVILIGLSVILFLLANRWGLFNAIM